MTPIFKSVKSTCLAACVASILDVDVSMVPALDPNHRDWFQHLFEFCVANGFSIFYWPMGAQVFISGHVVAIIRQPDGSQRAVVMTASMMEFSATENNETAFTCRFDVSHDPLHEECIIGEVVGHVFIGKQ